MVHDGDGTVSSEYHKVVESAEEVTFAFHPADFIGGCVFTPVSILYHEVDLPDSFVHGSPDERNKVVHGSPGAAAHRVSCVGAIGYLHLVAGACEIVVPGHICMEWEIGIGVGKESPGVLTDGEDIVERQILIRRHIQEFLTGSGAGKNHYSG